MNKKSLMGVGVLTLALAMSGGAVASEELCSRQKAATADLVAARDDQAPIQDVIAKIEESASSRASADVLSESVRALYADPSLGVTEAEALIYQRCMTALR